MLSSSFVTKEPQPLPNLHAIRPKILGTTFSQVQCEYLDLDYKKTFQEVCNMGFDVIRLCSYWNRIQPGNKRNYDWEEFDWLLNEAQKYNVDIILTIGIKAPRAEEFHLSDWVKNKYDVSRSDIPLDKLPGLAKDSFEFQRAVIIHTLEKLRDPTQLKYLQVENEPLNKLWIFGSWNRYLSPEYLEESIERARELAPLQKIMATNSISSRSPRNKEDVEAYMVTLALTDAIGLNIYSKIPIKIGPFLYYYEAKDDFYRELDKLNELAEYNDVEAWASEIQGEPWDHFKLVVRSTLGHPSSSPTRMLRLIYAAKKAGIQRQIIWGVEHGIDQKNQGNPEWNKTQRLLLAA